MLIPKFQQPVSSFHAELRQRTNQYFSDLKIRQTGNLKLYIKAVVLIVSFAAVYTHLVFFTSSNIWLSLFECVILGALTAGIGFNIMHDGAHGSFSKYRLVNRLAAMSINFLGANDYMWKTKHNVIHHTFTNVEGIDDDIDARPFLRLCETQKHYKIHRIQHLYFWMVYSILYLYWIFFSDYEKYFTKKVGNLPLKSLQIHEHISFWSFKIIHLVIFVIVPIYMVGFWVWLAGFVVYGLFAGVILSIVFQLAHTVQDTHFPLVNNNNNKLEDEWAIHQLKTTANFATKNKIVSWFTGGLNFQIEHHLFPNISHIHYPELSKIVKELCEKHGIKYIEFPKMRTAILSHIYHLKQMGKLSTVNI